MKKLTALLLVLFLLTGCAAAPAAPERETYSVAAAEEASSPEAPDAGAAVTGLSLRLLRESCREGENVLLSPLSIQAALGMTANGASGETLAQLTETLGMSREELNAWLVRYLTDNDQLLLANSLWIRDAEGLEIKPSFLEASGNYYRADVFKTPFDRETLSQINGWVAEKTENQIPHILDSIPDNAMLYLINALLFEADWEAPYEPYQVIDGLFLTENGTEQDAFFMNSTESAYLETENATGFLKYYKDRSYAFAALLPNEGITVSELLTSLDGETLHRLLSEPREAVVKASLPKFETDYSAELADTLKAMGITDAFDPFAADFSALGTCDAGNLCISQVRHKTAITVGEEGTKAAAATVVQMIAGSAFNPEMKFVTLNRPFLYMLIDCGENVPFFMGTLMDMESAAPEVQPPETLPPAPEKPPRLLVDLGGEPLLLDAGTYEWTVQREENIRGTTLACGPAPMDLAEEAPMAVTDADYARLNWEPDVSGWNVAPDSVEATLWDPGTGMSQPLNREGELLDISGKAGILRITARWEPYGTAEYLLTFARS